MLRLTIKNLLDKKLRFALTTLAVVFGVTMVVSVFTLTDSLRSSFTGLAEDIASGSDLTIRTVQTVGEEFDRPPVPEELAEQVLAIDAVASIDPGVTTNNTVITDDAGEAIIPQGPPALGLNWTTSQLYLVEGSEPVGPDQFVADTTTASDNDLVVGNTYTITSPVSQGEFELVGLFNFGSPDQNTSLGQTMAAFELDVAQEFLGLDGVYNVIGVLLESGADEAATIAAIQQAIGPDYEVVTNEVIQQETTDDFGEFIDIFNNILLAFAIIIVFVSAFIINNTFQIVVAQRIRELGLLRAIGATGAQVRNSVMLEALLVGVFSTVTGLVLGVLGGGVLRSLLNSLGFSLPSGPIELQARTIVWAVFIGVGITFASSIIPAFRARKISPIAAIQSDQRLAGASLTRRLVGGGILTGIGALLLINGLFLTSGTTNVLTNIGLGAVAVFIGVNVLSPSFARPVANALGAPIARVFGIPGQIGRGNAARSPRRTASTAGALMIGLALVGMAGVVGASLTTTFRDTFENSVAADYFVQNSNAGFDPTAGFSTQVADEIEDLDEFDSVVRYRFGLGIVLIEDETEDLFTSDFAEVERHLDGDIIAGGLTGADPATSIAVHEDPATDLALSVGDQVDITYPDGVSEQLTVAAIYTDATIFGNWMVDNDIWEQHMTRQDLGFVSATITGFSDDLPEAEQEALLAGAAAALEPLEEQFPSITAENRVDFRQSQEEQLNSFLAVIFVLLGLSLLIALIGITNTLALSVFERTCEIGLLRTVGMTRRQLRRAIRWEAVIIAIFGALLGIVLGVIFGVAAVIAIPDSFIKTITIPWNQLVVYLVIAAIAGVLAAILPARRASRLNVLDAINYE